MRDTIDVGDKSFLVEIERDESMGEPWKEHDGHGIITEWERRDKAPHERVLCEDHRSHRYYDVRESTELAKRDGWGCSHSTVTDGKFHHGHKSKREAIACAVDQDFNRMRGWCNDEWSWVGVIVTMLDDDGKKTDVTDSLWGIESDSTDYIDQTAQEMAESLAKTVNDELRAAESMLD